MQTITRAEGGALILERGAVGEVAQRAEAAAVVEEERPQPFRHGEHDMTVRYAGKQMLIVPKAPVGKASGVTLAAEVVALAAERGLDRCQLAPYR